MEFGALEVGARRRARRVELCLIARALGAHLAPVPYLGSAAVRYAVTSLRPPGAVRRRGRRRARAARAGLGVGRRAADDARATPPLSGRKVAVEHVAAVDRIAVVAAAPDGPALAVVAPRAAGLSAAEQAAFDPTAPMHAVDLAAVAVGEGDVVTGAGAAHASRGSRRRRAARRRRGGRRRGAHARRRARATRRERRQFGRTIGSFQALRHLLADMYVRQASAWSTVLYAAAALDEDAARGAADGRDRQGLRRRAPRARSRTARCRSSAASRSPRSTRRTASCGGSSCASSSSATPPTTSARSAGRSPPPRCRSRSADMRSDTMTTRATETGFNDPTRQRLEAITTGAEPEVVGPLLAEALHDPRWERCDVALISGGKSNLTYRVASDAGEVVLRRPPLGHILPTAHDMAREHRVLTALEGTAVPVPRVLHFGGADGPLGAPFYVMERVVGHVCRNALPPGYADTPAAARGDRRRARRRARRPAHGRPRRGRPRRLRAARRLHGAPAAALVEAVGGVEGARHARARRAARRARPHAARAARRGDRARRLPARQHDPSPDGARAASSRCSTGR